MSRGYRSFLVKLIFCCVLAGVIAVANIPSAPGNPHCDAWKPGDIVFLNGVSFRSKIVRVLQGYSSDYSHVGIIVFDNGVPYIVNADPVPDKVVKQRWDAVIVPSQVSGGAIYRLRGADSSILGTACATAERYARENVPFDHTFNLKNTDKLFCTELVWRAFLSAGVDLCKNAQTEHPHLFPADLLKSPELVEVVRF